MKELYRTEVQKEITKYPGYGKDLITEQDIAGLPEPVQKYFRYCGYLGKEKMMNAEIEWKEFYLKLTPAQDWTPMECAQFNSVPEPARIAYMHSKMLGIIPLDGRDKYQDGHGNMRIRLLKVIRVADAQGKEMDVSALVTILAESLFVPTYALQPYIEWKPIDPHSAQAVIRHNDTEASGVFYFNDVGEFIRFDTHDRYYSVKGKEYKRLQWTVTAEAYMEQNGIRFPSYLRGIWHLDAGEYEYFKGTIESIRFNI